MRHPEFPVVSFLCLPLLLCSLPSHIRAGSISILALISWLSVINIIRAVNTLVWANNSIIKLEVWCDITTKITIGFTYAVPAGALCILRHLERVSSTRHVSTTKEDKRRRQGFEGLMCFGLPMLFMGLHYIVQGHRFDLIEDLGCEPAQYISVAAVFILWVPPLTMSVVSMVYAGLALRHLLVHRISFVTHLQNSYSSMGPGRFVRLMALAITVTAWDAGTNIYLLYFNISLSGLRPYISWDNVHSNFSRVAVFPLYVFPPWLLKQFILQWWIIPVSCLIFFTFLGFGEEATSDYRAALVWVRRTFLRQKGLPSNSHCMPLPMHRLQSHRDVNLALPPSAVSSKVWDELSLKMAGAVSPASTMGTLDTSSLPPAFNSSWTPAKSDLVSGESSLDDRAPSFSESAASHAHPVEYHGSSRTLTVTVTNADDEMSSEIGHELQSTARTPSSIWPFMSSLASSPVSDDRRSMSSHLGTTTPEAYFSTPPPHQVSCIQFMANGQLRPGTVQSSTQQHLHNQYGGVHVTIEESVM